MSEFMHPNIAEAIREAKEKARTIFPCHANRASSIGHECLRELVYERTSWASKLLPSVDLQFIFDGGKIIEPYAESMLRDAGFQVIEQQRFFEIKEDGETLLTGHIDNKVSSGNGADAYPCEIKGLAGHTWDKLNTFQDFLDSPLFYVRRYPAQLLMYLYGTGHRHGCFLLISKQNWRPKDIWVDAEDQTDLIKSTLQKCRDINQHVREGTLPDYTANYELCRTCDFFHVCAPPLEGAGEIEINPELEEDLERWWELREAVSEWNSLDRHIKAAVKEKIAVLGAFRVSGKWVEKGGYEVKPSRYWKTEIKRI